MVKCEVNVDRASLVVGKGSIVLVDERQYELARQFLKPLDLKQKVEETKKVEEVKEEKVDVVKEEPKKENKQQKKK